MPVSLVSRALPDLVDAICKKVSSQLQAVLYSQRVAEQSILLSTTRNDEHGLHMPNGPVIQLLGVIQRPEALATGAQLRDHLLSLAERDPTVQRHLPIGHVWINL